MFPVIDYTSDESFQRSSQSFQDALNLHPDYVNLTQHQNVIFDVRYASTNNFVNRDVYGNYQQPFLHKDAADKFTKALTLLNQHHPHYQFILWDALRPRAAQTILFDKVKNTDEEPYVANPELISIHNYGFAIDLSIIDENGNELDMGTAFDAFTPLAEPQHETQFIQQGQLSLKQLQNRTLLKYIMERAGFSQLTIEWWHFDALPREQLQNHYPVIE